jgi:hypothetical protein
VNAGPAVGAGQRTATQEAERAAIERLEAFAARLERLGIEDFRQVQFHETDPGLREAARREAERVAEQHGLRSVLDDGRARVREYVLAAYGGSTFRPTWVALNWGLSSGTTKDRVATALAVEDAASAAVVEPYGTIDLLEVLRTPFELIAEGAPIRSWDEDRLLSPLREFASQRGPLVVSALVAALVVVAVVVGGGWAAIATAALLISLAVGFVRRRPS